MPEQLKGQERPLPSSGLCGARARQTLLFTATWPKSVERIAAKLLQNPVKLHVGKSGVLVANENIKQEIIVLGESEKHDRLISILVRNVAFMIMHTSSPFDRVPLDIMTLSKSYCPGRSSGEKQDACVFDEETDLR